MWLAVRQVDLDALGSSLRDAHLTWLILGVLTMNATVLPLSLRWRATAEGVGEQRPSRLSFAEVLACAVAASNVLPARPGEALRVVWLSRVTGGGLARAVASVVVDRASDVVVLAALLGATVPFVSRPQWLAALSIVAAAAGIGLVVGALLIRRHVGRRASGPGAQSRLRRLASALVRGLGDQLEPARIARVLLLTLPVWGLWAISAWASGRALGLHLGALELLFLAGTVNLGIAIPSSPGFVGTYQWLVVESLGLFGDDPTSAFGFSVLLQASWFVPMTVVGLLLMPRLGLSLRRPALASA
jgi:uncharacterized membrane protein YbhN (UPF0104 family)